MDLKDFVRDTIVSIVEAVAEAQLKTTAYGAMLNPADASMSASAEHQSLRIDAETGARANVESLEFDVAVTTGSTSGVSGGGGIKVVGVELGAKAQGTTTDERVSRIRFSIPIVYPPLVDKELHAARVRLKNEGIDKLLEASRRNGYP